MAAPMAESPLPELRSEGLRSRQIGSRKRRDAALVSVNHQQPQPKPKWIDSTKRLSKLPKSMAVVRPQDSYRLSSKCTLRSEGTNAFRTPILTSRAAFGRSYVAPIINPPTLKMRQNFKSVKAKVDSHLCPAMMMTSNLPASMPTAGANKPLTEAHMQLELLLNQIEQNSDAAPYMRRRHAASSKVMRRPVDQRPMPPAPAASPMLSARRSNSGKPTSTADAARRSLQILDIHTGSFITYEESLRKQRKPSTASATGPTAGSPLAPTTTTTTTTTTITSETGLPSALPNIPLVHNPQLLPPAKREALLQLLSRAEQHDKGIVDILRSTPGHDPSRETMRMMLQMLPLTPSDSPYSEKFWAGHRYLKERQKLHEDLKPDDMRFKEVKIIRGPNGQMYLSRTLEQELQDEKMVLEFMEAEMKRRAEAEKNENDTAHEPLNEREERAMRERAELDEAKERISNLRAKHNRSELKKIQKEAATEKHSTSTELTNVVDMEESEEMTSQQQESELASYNSEDLLKQRDQFQLQCQRSSLYNNPHNPEPWKLYANVAKSISSELIDVIDGEFNRSVANYIKDFVDSETRL